MEGEKSWSAPLYDYFVYIKECSLVGKTISFNLIILGSIPSTPDPPNSSLPLSIRGVDSCVGS